MHCLQNINELNYERIRRPYVDEASVIIFVNL